MVQRLHDGRAEDDGGAHRRHDAGADGSRRHGDRPGDGDRRGRDAAIPGKGGVGVVNGGVDRKNKGGGISTVNDGADIFATQRQADQADHTGCHAPSGDRTGEGSTRRLDGHAGRAESM